VWAGASRCGQTVGLVSIRLLAGASLLVLSVVCMAFGHATKGGEWVDDLLVVRSVDGLFTCVIARVFGGGAAGLSS
jgi:hypothetical protein